MLIRLFTALLAVSLLAGTAAVFAEFSPGAARMHLADDKPPAPGEAGKVTILDDPENVVSSEIWGAWSANAELTKQLNPESKAKDDEVSFTFKKSDEHAKKIGTFLESVFAKPAPKDKEAAFAELQRACTHAYAAGELAYAKGERSESFAFLLVSWRGNPHIIIMEGESDLESFNVMLARDLKGDGDLLFIGGDFNNQSFGAMKRKK